MVAKTSKSSSWQNLSRCCSINAVLVVLFKKKSKIGVATCRSCTVCNKLLGSLNDLHQRFFGAQHGLVQINLPVHKPPGHQKFFNAVNAFFFYHEVAIVHRKHFQNAVVPDNPFQKHRYKNCRALSNPYGQHRAGR